MRIQNILFITHGPLMYGAQQSLLALLSGIDRKQISPVMLSSREGPLCQEARKIGIPVVISEIEHWVAFGRVAKENLPSRWLRVMRGMHKRASTVAKIIQTFQIDLVYTNTVTVIEGAIAARMERVPHVWHLREHVAGNRDLKPLCPSSFMPYIISALSTQILTNSNALARAYACPISKWKIAVVYNGIDLRQFPGSSVGAGHDFREEFGIPQDARLIGNIGSITPRKGHGLFVEAASRLSASTNGLVFLVVGDGEPVRVDALKLKVKQAGLEHAFRFLGWRDDISNILSLIDLLLVTSEQEAFGRTVIEAMATGTPVVSTRSGGPEEIIIDGETGLLVNINDADAMANAARRILNDRSLAIRLTGAGKKRVRETFSVEAYVEAIQSTLLRLAHTQTVRH